MKILFFTGILFLFSMSSVAQLNAGDYRAVKIGNQEWMAENLDVSTYRNGDSIPQVQDPKVWSNLKTGAWCYYGDGDAAGSKYGKLYNWYAVMDPRGLAPPGWHIPSDAEWTTLAKFLGGPIGTSSRIKAAHGWAKAGNGNDETGFDALPGGTRSIQSFSFQGNYGYWWTSTEYDIYSAWNRFLGYNYVDIGRSTGWKEFGNSVRCIKDAGDAQNETKPIEVVAQPAEDPASPERPVTKEIAGPPFLLIGDRAWTQQNLNVVSFRNGDLIFHAKTDSEWKKAAQLKEPAWCYYNNDSSSGKYGKLYNWYAVRDKRGLAPEGWHIPSKEEWSQMLNVVGVDAGAPKIKSATGWKDQMNGTNEIGFDAQPGGFRTNDGMFYNVTMGAYWWSSSDSGSAEASYCSLTFFSDKINNENTGDKGKGFSVRCIKD